MLKKSSEEFEQRIFSDASMSGPTLSSFYQKLDKAEKMSFNTLSDGMDEKLKKAATYFDYDPDEISKDDYAYRPDMNFWTGNTYDIKDLDLRKPGIRKPYKRNEFETTLEEVLCKADFRARIFDCHS
ncbi:unnamed protein product [Fraxinus pennsylvanica]|uniref:Uncharacterized protein n=1 Tax=Fraxinus pennsylvanica TaxID=56036 RepID=A0AAD1YYF3_9LAMI|nr:unnamed protein product [Fraxinus pennsylvanica]